MRTTPAIQYDRFLESLRLIRERIQTETARSVSGLRVEKPSDDPAAAGEAVALRTRIAAADRYASNASAVKGFLSVTDSALSSLNDLLTSARAEAIRGASESTGAQARGAIATTIDSLREQAFALARTRFEGRYIFSGTDTQADPYDSSGNYQGNTSAIRLETGEGETITANIAATDAFGAGTGVFGALASLSDALRLGDTAAIQTGATSLEAALKTLSDARTVVGTRLESAQSAADRAAQAKVTLTSRLTEITGADLAEAITSLSNDRASEQMVLQTGARIGQRSLFDFLG